MADTDKSTKPEGTETTDEDPEGTEVDTTEEEAAVEAEVEAGVSDTVPRSELLKAIQARQAAKKRIREMEATLASERAKNETESETAVREASEKALKAATDKYKPALVKAGATAALLGASPVNGKKGIPRLLKLMDLDAIDLSEDNDLEGVEEEVLRLQEEYPELFIDPKAAAKKEEEEEEEEKPAARRKTTSRSQDGAGRKPPTRKLSTTEVLMKQLRGE